MRITMQTIIALATLATTAWAAPIVYFRPKELEPAPEGSPQLEALARRVEVRADLRLGARADELCDAPVVERPVLLHARGAYVLFGLGPAAAVRRSSSSGRHGAARTRRLWGARLFRRSWSTNGAARGSTEARPRPT